MKVVNMLIDVVM